MHNNIEIFLKIGCVVEGAEQGYGKAVQDGCFNLAEKVLLCSMDSSVLKMAAVLLSSKDDISDRSSAMQPAGSVRAYRNMIRGGSVGQAINQYTSY